MLSRSNLTEVCNAEYIVKWNNAGHLDILVNKQGLPVNKQDAHIGWGCHGVLKCHLLVWDLIKFLVFLALNIKIFFFDMEINSVTESLVYLEWQPSDIDVPLYLEMKPQSIWLVGLLSSNSWGRISCC